MSRWLRLCTPLKSNLKALFSSRNRLRALSDAILLLIGRCHVGHKSAYRLHEHGSACTLVADTQDVALGYPQTGAKYSQRQRRLRCEFCRELERTRRQVAVPTLARKNRADVCETAAIYSLSLLARFLSLLPRIVQVSHSNSESWQALEGGSRQVLFLFLIQ